MKKDISFELLDYILNNDKNKYISCEGCLELIEQYNIIIENLNDFIKSNFNIYELAQWIKSKQYYMDSEENYFNYPSRSLLYVELGDNIGSELSYEHLAVLVKQSGDKLYIVPCSSSERAHYKLKNYDKEYMLATEADGFPKETVLFLRESRWISKSRVLSKYKKRVEPEYFNKIYNRLLGDLFNTKIEELNAANNQIELYRKSIEKLETENKKHIKDIINLTDKLNEIQKDNDDLYEILDIKISNLKIQGK